jgi:hypothetical protein
MTDAFTEPLLAAGLTTDQVEACAAHFALLLRWNRTHNLTRITEPNEAALRHYLDSLVPLLAWEAPSAFVDVGSGAGFPGLLAALAWPAAKATLVEPALKRASFLRLAAKEMGLKVAVAAPGTVTAPRVLSRATFPPGDREQLAAYVAGDGDRGGEDRGDIAVWGHPQDGPTWSEEVATWSGAWETEVRGYAVAGVEPRALLMARVDRR